MSPTQWPDHEEDRIAYFPLSESEAYSFVVYDKKNSTAWIESDTSVEDYGIDER